MRNRTIAAILSVMMLLSLFAAYPAVIGVGAVDNVQTITATAEDNYGSGTEANLTITAPVNVLVGETFEVTYQFHDYVTTTGNPGCFVIDSIIDTDYVTLHPDMGEANYADMIVEPTTVYWELCSNPGGAATIGGDGWHTVSYVTIEEDPATADTLTIKVKYVANAVGAALFDINFVDFADAWDSENYQFLPDDFTVNVIEESVSEEPSEEPSQEESSEESSEEESSDVPAPDFGTQTVTSIAVDNYGSGTEANLTITAPVNVLVGETFEVTYQFHDYVTTTGNPGCFVIDSIIDTNYVTLHPDMGEANYADMIVEPTTVYWELCSNPGGAATIGGDGWHTVSYVTIEEDPATADTLTIKVKYVANAVGAALFDINFVDFADAWDSENYQFLPDDFTVNVIEEGGDDSSDVESSEVESSEVESSEVESSEVESSEVESSEVESSEVESSEVESSEVESSEVESSEVESSEVESSEVESSEVESSEVESSEVESSEVESSEVESSEVESSEVESSEVESSEVESSEVESSEVESSEVESSEVESSEVESSEVESSEVESSDVESSDVESSEDESSEEESSEDPVNEYTVEFVADGQVIDTQTVTEGGAATAPTAPEKVGYTFTGWDVDFSNVTGDLTVTAQYTINSYTVTFKADGQTVSTVTVNYGSAATAPTAPAKVGYTFTGWDVDFSNVTGDLTVTAQYTINSYTVTFKADGQTVSTVTVNHGSAATAPTAPAKVGYTFTGWDVDFSNVTGDLTVTAQYTINSYTVTFKADGQTVSTVTVNYGSAATAPTAPAKVGYTFTGWDVDFSNVTGDLTVTAQYTINSYTVEFVIDGEVVSTVTVEHGAAATAPVIPEKEGYTAEWDMAFDEITGDATVTVVYTKIPYAFGDVNGDGQINSLDAAQVLKYDAMMIDLDENALKAADVNGDGAVNSLDAAQILKFDAMIIDKFPIEQA